MSIVKRIFVVVIVLIVFKTIASSQSSADQSVVVSKAALEKVGASIPAEMIGEPVSLVKLYTPRWIEATETSPAYIVVEGSIFPVDPDGWPINFRVLLPSNWTLRAVQQGGGGMNGTITVREGRNPMLDRGFVLYGSDSGHQAGGMGGMGGGKQPSHLATGPAGKSADEWVLNEEAIRNLGYMQMKKTHDAAMVIIERIYGKRPEYNYYMGGSQGGREGLMVAQRYPDDYDGILADVPIVSFSTLLLAPELIRIQEIKKDNWVTPDKVGIIRAEFLKQCDKLDGLADGIINNYMASRMIFNVNDNKGPADPWAALRVSGTDPGASENSVSSKLTDGQIKTLEFIYSPYRFATPLANNVRSFGMWLPSINPDDFGTITGSRYKGQEGADDKAQVHSSLGTIGVTGFLMLDIKANPLDYVEGGVFNKRREEISWWLDAANPDLSAFYKKGGKIIITVGTMDFIASSGAQLDYYQSVLDRMKRKKVDKFARFYVIPQAGHGLSGRSYKENGDGEAVTVKNIPSPNQNDKIDLLISWVENGQAPPKTLYVNPEGRIVLNQEGEGYIICSYPEYPRYYGGDPGEMSSYKSTKP